MLWSYNPIYAVTYMVWAPSISLAATLEIDVSFFSSSYLDVSVQRVSSLYSVLGLLPNGLSHSDISGSNLVCKSPELFAAYHVLLRLQEPRHPPYALIYFLTTPHIPYWLYMRLYLISLIVSMNDDWISSIAVEDKGFEPLTPCVQGRCSSQLS